MVEDDWNLQTLEDESEEEDVEKKDLAMALGLKLPEDKEKNQKKND